MKVIRWRSESWRRRRPAGCAALGDFGRIELGMRAFLENGDFNAFTTTFEDLHGWQQLTGPGRAALDGDGYGFGRRRRLEDCRTRAGHEGDGCRSDGGHSFMEDYTYDLSREHPKVLGAHMLEVCEVDRGTQTVAGDPPALDRRQGDPARLVFNVSNGPAINATPDRYG